MLKIDIQELRESIEWTQEKIDKLEKQKKDLVKEYEKRSKPEGYKSCTSYNDYDTIHGSRAEYRLNDLVDKINKINEEIERLYNNLEFDKELLENKRKEIHIESRLKDLKTPKEKVRFLREVCKLTQKETAEKIGITEQWVYQLERRIKNERKIKEFNRK